MEARLRGAIEMTLGVEDVSLDSQFAQLGGDSLSAVRLSEVLSEMCHGVSVPVSLLLNPTMTLAGLIKVLEQGQADTAYFRVHGTHQVSEVGGWVRDQGLGSALRALRGQGPCSSPPLQAIVGMAV